MTKEREALMMALQALEKMDNCCPAIDPSGQDAHDTAYQTMHILRTVINEAQPEQEPVGMVGAVPGYEGDLTHCIFASKDVPAGTKIYTTPPKRECVGLTDDEIAKLGKREKNDLMDFIYENGYICEGRDYYFMKYARAVLAAEAKFKEKNHD